MYFDFSSPDEQSIPSEIPVARQLIESGDMAAKLARPQLVSAFQRRESILRAASFAAEKFLSGHWEEHADAVLAKLGQATDVSRVYLFQSQLDHESNTWRHFYRHEWVANEICPQIDNPELQGICFEEQGLGRWRQLLENGRVVSGTKGNFPNDESPLLEDVASVLIVPVKDGDQWWGFLGFDECRVPRQWDENDIEALTLAAGILGAAITRHSSDEALRLSEREMRALFDAMSDAIFVIDREGTYLKISTANEGLLYRPGDSMLGKTITSVIGGELGEHFLRTVRNVLSSGQSHRIEYPLCIQNRELWFSASISPLSEETVLWVARDISEIHEARETLREREYFFRLIAENANDAIAILRPDGSYVFISPAVERIMGYSMAEMASTPAFDHVHPDDLSAVKNAFERLISEPGRSDTATYRAIIKDGTCIWMESSGRSVLNQRGELEIYLISRDISERRATEERLLLAERKYRSIFENAVEGIFQTTEDGKYIDANPSLARIYGYSSAEELQEQLTNVGAQLYVEPRQRDEFIAQMRKFKSVSNFESQVRRKDGTVIWISENARAVYDEHGKLLYYEGTVEDITGRKVAEEQLLHNALHDRLTGLSNRALFMDRLTQAFGRLKRHPESLFAVLFLDFDRFKNINDSLGHMAGDELLVSIAERLQRCLRPGDTVSRLGGDEFAVLLEDVNGQEDAIAVAERIQKEVAQPFTLVGQEVFSSASIGIALGHKEYEKPEDLLRDADMAMYRAKALGKARHEVFDTGMHIHAVALLQLETDLRWAIEREEFRLHYQPIVSLETGQITGFEALIRWQHPERGLVLPSEFIPIAEETGWIVPMGRWVLAEACHQLKAWQEATEANPPLTMSVNLSSKQFSQNDLIDYIEELLTNIGLPSNCLKLEITESAIMENAQSVTDRLLRLRSLGVRLGLDDFGTGYSSLSYLHRFPLDTLKIDRSFIARMDEGGEKSEIVRTIVTLGKNLSMNVVAEGVESYGQLQQLRDLSCSQGQGFFFARPLAAEEAFRLLKGQPSW